ncbi:hypothetical protein BDY19DRAFT_906113 [Irpex rosettiformis]|uniref:Uncharacterized protein n=1 Tax=Irpex rosettiformis TaxID=378272 RepID=A0ACB8U4S5_9APHY|nr:hypothetical protein BDY19DRAFT_906113 [Irpex rosettiformis]
MPLHIFLMILLLALLLLLLLRIIPPAIPTTSPSIQIIGSLTLLTKLPSSIFPETSSNGSSSTGDHRAGSRADIRRQPRGRHYWRQRHERRTVARMSTVFVFGGGDEEGDEDEDEDDDDDEGNEEDEEGEATIDMRNDVLGNDDDKRGVVIVLPAAETVNTEDVETSGEVRRFAAVCLRSSSDREGLCGIAEGDTGRERTAAGVLVVDVKGGGGEQKKLGSNSGRAAGDGGIYGKEKTRLAKGILVAEGTGYSEIMNEWTARVVLYFSLNHGQRLVTVVGRVLGGVFVERMVAERERRSPGKGCKLGSSWGAKDRTEQ